MEAVAHWTQDSIADFIYSISSNFVAQVETKIEEEGISQNDLAIKMNKTSGRVSQVLNNPGNLSTRVMVELARAVGMKVSIVAYDDGDPSNDRGPIDPDVFRRCWERAGRPENLFEVEEGESVQHASIFIAGIHGSYGDQGVVKGIPDWFRFTLEPPSSSWEIPNNAGSLMEGILTTQRQDLKPPSLWFQGLQERKAS
jgi:transcriptional regulator with XRE-family HTH domain